ncbi:hypothetical protein FNJ84_21775 [Paracoccus sp. M683]|uniref:hypothetical protein n=1 Tax=Paracoccus sp. M683 TaxID=2594268 RepID=UPI00117DA627|nr:hypothetical protein [Paracoccus sp. M683]TRW90802.1 hypothetical protein FNJ84_21775 [Paracoccus sp. M683]
MFTKSILTAVAAAVALAAPVAAAEANSGRDMQAAILNLDSAAFTTNELALIGAEKNDQRKAERAAYILDQKNATTGGVNGGHDMQASILGVDGAAFNTNELGQIAGEKTQGSKANRAAFIASENGRDVISSAVASDYTGAEHRGRDDS